ncbi:MAG: hypothetical protein DLM54_01045 [Acidimicrobiales bacterium]|nr:MAG: hypothetical protein DLM54_01045 [Acidimicrobiales bacterium]
MPVPTAEKIASLAEFLGSKRQLALSLGVDPAQVTRWSRGSEPDPLNAQRVDVLELVLSELDRLYDHATTRRWLEGVNPHLGNRRPIDVVRAGRPEELLAALRLERAGSPA